MRVRHLALKMLLAAAIGAAVLPAAASAQDPSEIPTDDVMFDVFAHQTLGLDTELLDQLDDPRLVDLFGLSPADPLPRSSFFAGTLDELGIVSELGDVPVVSGFGLHRLNLAGPVPDPQVDVWDQIAPRVDIAFPPPRRRGVDADSLLALAVRIEADITDPAFCAGRKIGLLAVVDNPSWGDAYTANPNFTGEYYAGGNFFPVFSQIDCEPIVAADTYLDDEVIRDLANPGAAFLTAGDGVTNAVMFFSEETIDPSGSLRFVLFEHTDGESFTLENTRHQLWPDFSSPAAPIADAVQVFSGDFTLGPPGPGSLLNGDPVVIDVPIGDRTLTFNGPTAVEPDGGLFFDLCVTDGSGAPVTGVEWLATLGEPPSGPDAVHSADLLDDSGCVRFGFPAPPSEGVSSLYTSDGSTTWFVTPIDIGPIEVGPIEVDTVASTTTQPAVSTTTLALTAPEQPATVSTTSPALTPPEQPVSASTTTEAIAQAPQPGLTATTNDDDDGFPIVPFALTVGGLGTIGIGIRLVRKNPRQPAGSTTTETGTRPPGTSDHDHSTHQVDDTPALRPPKGSGGGSKPPPRIGLGTRIANGQGDR